MQIITFFKIVRIAIVVNLIPLIRSCDDAIGRTDTFGFPFPYSQYTTVVAEPNYWIIIINLSLLFILLTWLVNQHNKVAQVIIGLPFFLMTLVLLPVMYLIGMVLFLSAMFVLFAINEIISIDSDYAVGLLVDVFVRLEFVGILFLLFLFAKKFTK